MKSVERHNLKLTGSGTASGGLYQNVRVTGDGTVNGDLDCIDLTVAGNFDLKGSIHVNHAKITGNADVKGAMEAEECTVIGSFDIADNVSIKELKLRGEFKSKGNVVLEEADAIGLMDIAESCSADTFICRGPLKVGGLLNAGIIDVEMHHKCWVKEIGGEKISIKRGNDMIIKKILRSIFSAGDYYNGELTADIVEGDDVYLEYAKVKVVRGENIEIGPGCEIDMVEYRDRLQVHEKSNVKENKTV